jgi:hypothetical protein
VNNVLVLCNVIMVFLNTTNSSWIFYFYFFNASVNSNTILGEMSKICYFPNDVNLENFHCEKIS